MAGVTRRWQAGKPITLTRLPLRMQAGRDRRLGFSAVCPLSGTPQWRAWGAYYKAWRKHEVQ